jgi:hypothetical protein
VKLFNKKAKLQAHDKTKLFFDSGNHAEIHDTVKLHFHTLVEKFFSEEYSPKQLVMFHNYIDVMFGIQAKIYGACNDRMAHVSVAHLLMTLHRATNTQLPCLKYTGPAYNQHTNSYLICCGQQLITARRFIDTNGKVAQQVHVKVLDAGLRRIHRHNPDILSRVMQADDIPDCDSSVAGSIGTVASRRRPFTLANTPSRYCERRLAALILPDDARKNVKPIDVLPTLPTLMELKDDDVEDSVNSFYQNIFDSDDEDDGPPSFPQSPQLSQLSQSDSPYTTTKRTKESLSGGSKTLQRKRTVKRRRNNNRKTQQYSNKKKHSSSKKKSVITKKTKVSKSKRNNKTKTKRSRNH